MGWDRHKLLGDVIGQTNMSHGQSCKLPLTRAAGKNGNFAEHMFC